MRKYIIRSTKTWGPGWTLFEERSHTKNHHSREMEFFVGMAKPDEASSSAVSNGSECLLYHSAPKLDQELNLQWHRRYGRARKAACFSSSFPSELWGDVPLLVNFLVHAEFTRTKIFSYRFPWKREGCLMIYSGLLTRCTVQNFLGFWPGNYSRASGDSFSLLTPQTVA